MISIKFNDQLMLEEVSISIEKSTAAASALPVGLKSII
jgi:hypothetical protein